MTIVEYPLLGYIKYVCLILITSLSEEVFPGAASESPVKSLSRRSLDRYADRLYFSCGTLIPLLLVLSASPSLIKWRPMVSGHNLTRCLARDLPACFSFSHLLGTYFLVPSAWKLIRINVRVRRQRFQFGKLRKTTRKKHVHSFVKLTKLKLIERAALKENVMPAAYRHKYIDRLI